VVLAALLVTVVLRKASSCTHWQLILCIMIIVMIVNTFMVFSYIDGARLEQEAATLSGTGNSSDIVYAGAGCFVIGQRVSGAVGCNLTTGAPCLP
jgi:hypothetical protein